MVVHITVGGAITTTATNIIVVVVIIISINGIVCFIDFFCFRSPYFAFTSTLFDLFGTFTLFCFTQCCFRDFFLLQNSRWLVRTF